MSGAATAALIEQRLIKALDATGITVVDDSARHAGHAGAASGGGHFNVRVVSPKFTGASRLSRHRLVYDSLSDLMHRAIHALAIEALTPDEAADAAASSPKAQGTPQQK